MTKFNNGLTTILNACDNKKAYDFSLIDISKLTSMTDYFIICSGNNERQTVSIADEVIEKMAEEGVSIHHKEGYQKGRWILLDYGFVVVHIFHRNERLFYDLESLWADGTFIDVEEFGIQNWK